jgi:hypothetical protein
MKKLFLDIETLPAEEAKHSVLKTIYDDKKAKGKKIDESFESYIIQTSLDGSFGRIFCIGVAVDDEPVNCLTEGEAEILKNFWEMAKDADLFVGHNIFDFDLRFIYQRSIILGIKPTRDLSFQRYKNNPVYDTMYEWSKWNMMDKISLDKLAKALGLKSSKEDGMKGSLVYDYFKTGKHQEIYNYCKADVEVTRAIYKKMNFES